MSQLFEIRSIVLSYVPRVAQNAHFSCRFLHRCKTAVRNQRVFCDGILNVFMCIFKLSSPFNGTISVYHLPHS